MIKTKLIDMRNWFEMKPQLIDEISHAGLIGFDIESEDSGRHAGLESYNNKNRLVFDTNRTTVCGFSIYCDGAKVAYYINLAHADVENRIPWSEARQLLDAKGAEAHWIAHNAPFELCMMKKSLGYDLGNIICTLQMAVSHHNADQYDQSEMRSIGFGGLVRLLPAIAEAFTNFDPFSEPTESQAEIIGQVLGKTSTAEHSYNGLVNKIAYGYGLKRLTKQLFSWEQKTFEDTLNGKAHMGELTGEEVAVYGAEDAYWTVRLLNTFLPRMAMQNDNLINTFMNTENEMTKVFADVWGEGMRIDLEQVARRRGLERETYAEVVRELQLKVREMLPFPSQPNQWLAQEKWYKPIYRERIVAWANSELPSGSFETAHSTSGAVSNTWAEELGQPKSRGPNVSHYMMLRTLIYDLPGVRPIFAKGKVASDKAAREKAASKYPEVAPLIEILDRLSGIEQRMKLFITPYLQLCDPETQKIYPVLSSKLNSRRMATSYPNPMQLSKRGESTYIRGFFLPDADDHVIVSIDWSQIEVVLIGDYSRDPAFYEAYGKLPYQDLHRKAAAEILGKSPDEITKEERSKLGKTANFGYWYSGALSTTADVMGWSSDKMWEAVENYREGFAVAEEWRVDLINEARDNGYVTLPDGHRRTSYEASYEWQKLWTDRWNSTDIVGLQNFGQLFVKRISARAGNQIVNSMIQGSCATLAKRSILEINKLRGDLRFRFMIPIHDELVFSVHRDDVVPFLRMAKKAMCDHPDIIKTLMIDATASVGRTFEPYHPEKAPFGQIELDEAPPILGFTKDQKLDEDQIQQVVNYLFEEEHYETAAA